MSIGGTWVFYFTATVAGVVLGNSITALCGFCARIWSAK